MKFVITEEKREMYKQYYRELRETAGEQALYDFVEMCVEDEKLAMAANVTTTPVEEVAPEVPPPPPSAEEDLSSEVAGKATDLGAEFVTFSYTQYPATAVPLSTTDGFIWVPKKHLKKEVLERLPRERPLTREEFDAMYPSTYSEGISHPDDSPRRTKRNPARQFTVAPGLKGIEISNWPVYYQQQVKYCLTAPPPTIVGTMELTNLDAERKKLWSEAHRHNTWLWYHLQEVRAKNDKKIARKEHLRMKKALRVKRATLMKHPGPDGFIDVLNYAGEKPVLHFKCVNEDAVNLEAAYNRMTIDYWNNLFAPVVNTVEQVYDLPAPGPAQTARRNPVIVDEECSHTSYLKAPPLTLAQRVELIRKLRARLHRVRKTRVHRKVERVPTFYLHFREDGTSIRIPHSICDLNSLCTDDDALERVEYSLFCTDMSCEDCPNCFYKTTNEEYARERLILSLYDKINQFWYEDTFSSDDDEPPVLAHDSNCVDCGADIPHPREPEMSLNDFIMMQDVNQCPGDVFSCFDEDEVSSQSWSEWTITDWGETMMSLDIAGNEMLRQDMEQHLDNKAVDEMESQGVALDDYCDFVRAAQRHFDEVPTETLIKWAIISDNAGEIVDSLDQQLLRAAGNKRACNYYDDTRTMFAQNIMRMYTDREIIVQNVDFEYHPIVPVANAPAWNNRTGGVSPNDGSDFSSRVPRDEFGPGAEGSMGVNRAIKTYLFSIANNALIKDIHDKIMSGPSASGGAMSTTDFNTLDDKLERLIRKFPDRTYAGSVGGNQSTGSVPANLTRDHVQKLENSVANMEHMLRNLSRGMVQPIDSRTPNFADSNGPQANGWHMDDFESKNRRDPKTTVKRIGNEEFMRYSPTAHPGNSERLSMFGFNLRSLCKLLGVQYDVNDLPGIYGGKYSTDRILKLTEQIAEHAVHNGWVSRPSVTPPVVRPPVTPGALSPELSSLINSVMVMNENLNSLLAFNGIPIQRRDANGCMSLDEFYDATIIQSYMRQVAHLSDEAKIALANGDPTELNENDAMPVGNILDVDRTGEVVHEADGNVITVPVKGFVAQYQLNDIYNVKALVGRRMRLKQKTAVQPKRGDGVLSCHLPHDCFSEAATNPYFRDLIRHFASAKFTFRVRCTTNSPLTYGGIMYLHWDWYGRTTSSFDLTPELASTGNYVRWDLSKQEYVEMVVPNNVISHYLSRNFNNFAPSYLGRFDLISASNVLIPAECAKPTFTMYVDCVNCETHTLVPSWYSWNVVPNGPTMTTKNVSSYSYTSIPGMSVPFPMNFTGRPNVVKGSKETINEYISQYSVCGTFQWTNTDEPKTLLHQWVSTPTQCILQSDQKFQPTCMAEYARHYSYFTGGIEYEVEVCSSNFTSGKLCIVADAGTQTTTGNFMAKMHHVIDLRQQHSCQFSAPYNAPTPYRPTFFVGTYGDQIYTRNYTFFIYVEEPLITGIAGTAEVTVNIYSRPMVDFEFAVAGNGLGHTNVLARAVVQGYPSEPMATVTTNRAKYLSSEPWMDQYKLLQRYMDYTSFYLKKDYTKDLYFPVMPRFPEGIENNVLANIAKHYAVWNGGLRYKFKVTKGRGTIAIGHVPNTGIVQHIKNKPFGKQEHNQGIKGGFSWGAYQKFDVKVEDTFEIEAPYYSMYEFLYIPLKFYKRTPLPIQSCNNGNLIVQPISIEEDVHVEVSIAISEDFAFYGRSNAMPKKGRRADDRLNVVRYQVPSQRDTEVTEPLNIDRLVEDDSGAAPNMPPNPDTEPLPEANGTQEHWSGEEWEPETNGYKEELQRIAELRAQGGAQVKLDLWTEFRLLLIRLKKKKEKEAQANGMLDGVKSYTSKIIMSSITADKEATEDLVNELTSTFFNCLVTCIKSSVHDLYRSAFGELNDFIKKITSYIPWSLTCEVIVYLIVRQVFKRLDYAPLFDYIILPLIIANKLSAHGRKLFDEAKELMKMMIEKDDKRPKKKVDQVIKLERALEMQEEFCSTEVTPEAMGIWDTAQYIVPVLAVLTAASKINPGKGVIAQTGTFMQNLGKTRDMEKGSDYISKTLDSLKRKFLPTVENSIEEITKENATQIMTWLEEFNLEQMKFQLRANPNRHVVIAQAKRHSEALTELVKRKELDSCWMNRITRANERIAKFENYFYKQNNVQRFRRDPMHICFVGKPGVGKSTIMSNIEHQLMKLYNYLPYQSYTRTRTDHWDGFSPECKLIRIDDLGQHHTQEACDIMELILMKSNNPFIVPMADLEEKGMSFNADFIVSSTNQEYLTGTLEMLRTPSAFHRRRDLLIRMYNNDLKIPASENKDFFNSRFQVLNPKESGPHLKYRGEYTYDQILQIIDVESKIYQENQDRLLTQAQERDDELMAQPNNQDYKILGTCFGAEIFHNDVLKRFLKKSNELFLDQLGKVKERKMANYLTSMDTLTIEALTLDELNKIEAEEASTVNEEDKTMLGSLKSRILTHRALSKATELTIQATDMIYGAKYTAEETMRSYGDKIGDFGIDFCLSVRDKWSKASNAILSAYNKSKVATKAFAEKLDIWLSNYNFQLSDVAFYLTAVAAAAAIAYGSFRMYKKFTGIANKVIPLSNADTGGAGDYESETYKLMKRNQQKAYADEQIAGWWDQKHGAYSRRDLWELQQDLSGSEWRSKFGKNAKTYEDFLNMEYSHAYRSRGKTGTGPNYVDAHAPKYVPPHKIEGPNVVYSNGSPIKVMGEQNLACPDMPDFIGSNIVDNICLVDVNRQRKTQRGLLLCTNMIMTTAHFWLTPEGKLRDEWPVKLYIHRVFEDKLAEVEINKNQVCVQKNIDTAFVHLDCHLTRVKNIMKYFATDKDILDHSTANIIGLKYKDNKPWPMVEGIPQARKVTTPVRYRCGVLDLYTEGIYYDSIFHYGDCGSVIVTADEMRRPKIVGLHVAGDPFLGKGRRYASFVRKENLTLAYEWFCLPIPLANGADTTLEFLIAEKAFKDFNPAEPKNFPFGFTDFAKASAVIGLCASAFHSTSIMKPKIRPSVIHDALRENGSENKKQPSILSVYEPRNTIKVEPTCKAVNKYLSEPCDVKEDDIILAISHLGAKMQPLEGEIKRRLLNMHEAINGIEGTNIKLIDRTTSPGEPWVSKFHGKGKENILTEEYPYQFRPEADEIRLKTLARIAAYKSGTSVPTVTVTFPKDELKGHAKIREVNTRTIECLPMDLTLATRIYFGAWISMLYANNNRLSCQGGLNPMGPQWAEVLRRLKQKGSSFIAGDYKNFDGKPSKFMIDGCVEMVNLWYNDGPTNARVRRTIVKDSYERITIANGFFVQLDHGIPSGFALTMAFNSCLNDIYKCVAWINIMPRELRSLSVMEEETDAITLGDDHVISLSDEVKEYFNVKTFGDYLDSVGVGYTDANKNHYSTAPKYVEEKDISFLKRTWRSHPQDQTLKMAPLDQDTIEERLWWVKEAKNWTDNKVRTINNIQTSLSEATLHGEEYFNDIRDRAFAAWKTANLPEWEFPTVSYLSEMADLADLLRNGRKLN